MPIALILIIIAGVFLSSGSGAISLDGILPTPNSDPFTKWDYLFHQYSSAYSVPWRWMKAICMNESNLGQARSVAEGLANPSDVSGSASSDGKSWGLMQTTLPTARQFESAVTEVALNDPNVSVRIAAKYIQWVMNNYFDDEESVVRAYNGGPGFKDASTNTYWSRYKANMATIQARQPGNENEIG